MPSTRFAVLGFASAGHTATHMMMLIYATIVITLEDVWQVSYGELIALASTGWLLFGLGALPAGFLADRIGAARMMQVFFFGLGLSSIATGFADTTFELLLGLAAIGLFASIYHPVGIPWLLRKAGEKKGFAIGVNGFFGAVGVAIAPVMAVVCIEAVDWRAAFYIPGGLITACGVLQLLLVRDDERGISAGMGSAPGLLRTPSMMRLLAALMVIAFFAGLVFHTSSVAMPKLFEQSTGDIATALFGAEGADTSIFVTILYLLAGGVQIGIGVLADRLPKRAMFISSYVVQIPLLVVIGYMSGGSLLGLALLAVCLSMGFQAVEDLLVVRSVPESWLSRVFAFRFVVAMGAGVVAPLLVGVLFEWTGDFTIVFIALAIFAAVVALTAMTLPSDRSPSHQPVVQPAE